MQDSLLVVAQAFGTQAEAELAKGALGSAGIDSMVQADTAGGMRIHLAWSALGFRVLVREEDLAAARKILEPLGPDELVLVQTFATQDQADAALGELLSAGIAATLQDDCADHLRLEMAWSHTGFRVLVPKDDEARARLVLGQPR